MKQFLRKYIGDKHFYKRVLALMIPIMVQNGITNFVNMLDNVMVGRVGNVEMTGVAISNQLIFVFNLCIFGAISGASIFGAQFYGKGDHEGVKHTFRFKIILCIVLSIIGISIFYLFGNQLTALYLTGEGNPADIAATMKVARNYILIMFIGLLPYALTQCYSGTLRETGQATLPMIAGICAVFVNLCLNYILIFGKFGAPVMGVRGAALATVISRFVELAIVATWTHSHASKNQFIVGVFKSLYIPKQLIGQITVKGLPLLINETMFGAGMAVLNQCYSTLGYDVVSANNICQTFFNVFGVAFMAVGASIAIILGQMLGAGKLDEAKDSGYKLVAFSLFVSILVSTIYFAMANVIPDFYNTTDSVKHIASNLMKICALTMPLDALSHAFYFTLRSGGKIMITLLFDSGFLWGASITCAFLLCRFTPLSVMAVYGICQSLNLIKVIGGSMLVEKGIWLNNMVK